jgi:ParB/RepB/Spo0J family partition protein
MTAATATPLAIVPQPTEGRFLADLLAENVYPSVNNPRRTIDAAGLQDLKASIEQFGIQEPLLVRMMPADGGGVDCYEVVSGHRRLMVAKLLRLKHVPCLVVRGMSDAEASEAAIVANLQRVDIHPVEEAEAFEQLLQVLGSIPAVAARMGKEQSYVAKILRLCALTLYSRDAMRAGLITIDHALLLARLAEAEQNAALKWALDRNAGSTVKIDTVLAERVARVKEAQDDRAENPGASSRYFRPTWEAESVVRLRAWIEAESGILLSRAPWSLTEQDFLLPDVGPCAECPKNSQANTPLFGDLEMGEATCTDGACFAAKTAGFVQIEMRKAGHDEIAKPKVLVPRLSWKISSVKPSIVPNDIKVIIETPGRCGETANPAKVLKYGQWIDAKPGSCKYVRPGVTLDWSDAGDRGYMGGGKKLRMAGETVQVCIAVGCKVHPKGWEKQQGHAADKPKPSETPAEREAREAAVKAYEEAERPVRVAFMKLLLASAMEKREVVLRELVKDAYNNNYGVEDVDLAFSLGIVVPVPKGANEHALNRSANDAIEKYISTAMVDELIRIGAALQHAELLAIEGPGRKDAERKAMEAAAKKLGFKWAAPEATKPKAAAKPAAKKAAKKPAKK